MIIRKPYAFLIRNFRKIHIFLFILCGFVLYNTTRLNTFISEFLRLGTYNENLESVSMYINFFNYIILILILFMFVSIMILLKKKNKPWKVYLVPILCYFTLFIVYFYTRGFFSTYSGNVDTISMRAVRDILFMVNIFQYITFLILIIRILGVDLNKFDFKSDKEFLELDEDDREEIEINIEFDKYSIKRNIKMFLRNAKYYYLDHKKIILTLCTVFILIISYQLYNLVFITNKSYKEGKTFISNGYEIKINKSYYSDKDLAGNVIDKNSGFIIVNVYIKNNFNKRNVNFKRFHIMNKTNNYVPTFKLYQTEFLDFGNSIDQQILYKGDYVNTNLIYKVNKKDKLNKFVMYYQEFNKNNKTHLRKIKLNIEDLSTIKNNKEVGFNEEIKIKVNDKKESIIFDDYEIVDKIIYTKERCNYTDCFYDKIEANSKKDYNILKLGFVSNYFDGSKMIDFLSIHGKIKYISKDGKRHTISIKNSLPTNNYFGKYVYIDLPIDVDINNNIEIEFIFRNNKYKFIIK